jgi:RNA polymerase sigma-70 factor (ECF subfamily)
VTSNAQNFDNESRANETRRENPPAGFAPTRWTLVQKSRGKSPEARTALAELCEKYYQPVLDFLRTEGRTEDAARELAQAFFARILSGNGFDGALPELGRFRSYVIGALKHFIIDQRRHEHRQKRGGGTSPKPLDETEDDSGRAALEIADEKVTTPDASFDRAWAMTVMARSLEALRKELVVAGKIAQFDALKPWLMGDRVGRLQEEVGRELGLSPGAVKIAIHRLRKRYGEQLREEIAQTLEDRSQVEEELRHLILALS